MRKNCLRLLPGGVLLLAATIALHVAALREPFAALFPVYPYAVFAGGILLALRFNRSRLVLALLALALSERALAHLAPGPGETTAIGLTVFNALATLLPLNLGALSWISERGLLTRHGRLRIALLVLQVALVATLARPEATALAAFLGLAPIESPVGLLALPQAALAAFAVGFLLVMGRFVREPNAIEGGSVLALVASFLALVAGPAGVRSAVYLSTGGLILVVALVEAWHAMAYVDELTGLPGRRALREALLRLDDRYVIAMVDIDHFKRFNDDFGHEVGDQLLRMVASKLAGIEGGGRSFRYGGEEFALIFPGRSLEEAIPPLEALRVTVERTPFVVRGRLRARKKPAKPRPGADRRRVTVTISIGVAEANQRNSTPDQVVSAADVALYRAKRTGRNRVCS